MLGIVADFTGGLDLEADLDARAGHVLLSRLVDRQFRARGGARIPAGDHAALRRRRRQRAADRRGHQEGQGAARRRLRRRGGRHRGVQSQRAASREPGARQRLPPAAFAHRGFYNDGGRPRRDASRGDDAATVRWPGGPRAFAAGERIHTENSYKYSPAEFPAMLAAPDSTTSPAGRTRAATSRCSTLVSRLSREAHAGELPARIGGEEVAVGGANVRGGRRAAATAQHVLPAHELAVVLAHGAGRGTKARVRRVVAARPFPHVAEHLRGVPSLAAERQRMKRAGSARLPPTAAPCARAPIRTRWAGARRPIARRHRPRRSSRGTRACARCRPPVQRERAPAPRRSLPVQRAPSRARRRHPSPPTARAPAGDSRRPR